MECEYILELRTEPVEDPPTKRWVRILSVVGCAGYAPRNRVLEYRGSRTRRGRQCELSVNKRWYHEITAYQKHLVLLGLARRMRCFYFLSRRRLK